MRDLTRVDGRVAVVTGASSGIGQAVALELGARGADLCVNYLAGDEQSERAAGEVVATLEGMGRRAFAYGADVSKGSQVQAMVEAIVARFGCLDICVNNAGVTREASFLEVEERDWDIVLGVNLKGAFLCAQAAAQVMVAGKRRGRIINISSVHEDLPFPGFTPYACAKGGVRMLTRTAALELAPYGITMVGVGPGAIATPINRATLDDPSKKVALEQQIPLGRIGEPEEVARLVAYLASDAAAYITGTTYFIDGGLMQHATGL